MYIFMQQFVNSVHTNLNWMTNELAHLRKKVVFIESSSPPKRGEKRGAPADASEKVINVKKDPRVRPVRKEVHDLVDEGIMKEIKTIAVELYISLRR